MANETTSSTISELYTEIVAEAMFTASEQSIMKGLVRNYTIAGGGKSVEVPIYPTVSASAVSEASDLSNTAINPSSVTITASEVGIMTTLTDLARNQLGENYTEEQYSEWLENRTSNMREDREAIQEVEDGYLDSDDDANALNYGD